MTLINLQKFKITPSTNAYIVYRWIAKPDIDDA